MRLILGQDKRSEFDRNIMENWLIQVKSTILLDPELQIRWSNRDNSEMIFEVFLIKAYCMTPLYSPW